MCHWYAKKRARLLDLRNPSQKDYSAFLDNPYCLVATHLLQNGINSYFPNVKPDMESEFRFFVHLKDWGSSLYVIHDDDLDLQVEIDKELLDNPDFNLIQWYFTHAMADGRFHNQYVMYHKHHYWPVPDGFKDEFYKSSKLGVIQKELWSIEMIPVTMSKIQDILNKYEFYPGDDAVLSPIDPTYNDGDPRFRLVSVKNDCLCIYDRIRGFEAYLSWNIARSFPLGNGMPNAVLM